MLAYNKLLAKDEEQLQFLLQAVSDHHSAYPDAAVKHNNPIKRTLRI